VYRIAPFLLPFGLCACFPEVDLKGAALGQVDGELDADGDGFAASEDCDDENAAISPDADEICDGIDNNCDGTVDPDSSVDATDWYADADGDGFGIDTAGGRSCTLPDNAALATGDCDDDDETIHPDASEVCDDIDNDCDGLVDGEDDSIDSALLTTFYADRDSDAFGDSDDAIDACAQPDGYVVDGTDCDDAEATVNPDAVEVCDDIDNDCDTLVDDEDDSVDSSTYRGFYVDGDGDGYGAGPLARSACATPSGYAATNDDCADDDASVNPGAVEVCDELDTDEDCNELADDRDPDVDTTTATRWYTDADDDGYGSDSDTGALYCDDPSDGSIIYSDVNTDCDDGKARVNPGADELCDPADLDEDCDGLSDDDDPSVAAYSVISWYPDSDDDSYGDRSASSIQACEDPSTTTDAYVTDSTDCDDADREINPGATEICDPSDIDEDCDSLADDDDPSVDTSAGTTYYPDADGDGYGSLDATGDVFCDEPASGYFETADDCDDEDWAVNPGAVEVCNDKDDDCDASTGQAGMAQFVDSSGSATDLQSTLAAGTATGLASWTSSTDGTLWICEGTWYVDLSVDDNHAVDLLGPDGSSVTTLDGAYSSTIVTINQGSEVEMSGFTIQSGYNYAAGGMLLDRTTFTGSDLVFVDNVSTYGGALYSYYAEATFSDTTFTNNGSYYGGAGFLQSNSSSIVSFENSTFEDNDGYERGGAFYLDDTATVLFTDSTFDSNIAYDDGGGIYQEAGYVSIDTCTFEDNYSSYDGGALYITDDSDITDTRFIDNEAGDDGGGIYFTLGQYEDATIVGSTTSSSSASSSVFSGNTAADNGDAIYVRIASDWSNGGTLSVSSVDFGTQEVYHRTSNWSGDDPGDAASFSCTYWLDCF
jgi:predicted outer membrane repeat protein